MARYSRPRLRVAALRLNSRDSLDAARPNRRAISRTATLCAIPDGRLRLKQSVDLIGAGAASGGVWAPWGAHITRQPAVPEPAKRPCSRAVLGAGSGALSAASTITASTTTSSVPWARHSSPRPRLSSCWYARRSQRRCWRKCRIPRSSDPFVRTAPLSTISIRCIDAAPVAATLAATVAALSPISSMPRSTPAEPYAGQGVSQRTPTN